MMVKKPLSSLGSAALVGLAFACSTTSAFAFCPSYTLSSSSNNKDCGIEAVEGTNPSTAEWNDIFSFVSKGPGHWGNQGPSVGDLEQGCYDPQPRDKVTARFPCELIKAIARAESGWQQFCVPTGPADQKGGPERTIISFDCGYGVGQVTSGMHIGENPDFDRERVAGDATYNLATGMRILTSKWNVTACVGDKQTSTIEHWYSATWAYNGLAYKNNPNNPNYDADRGVWKPTVGGSAPYQEKVFGRMEHTGGLWEPTEVAYPDPGDVGTASKPEALPDPSCASPTDCQNTRPLHQTTCHDDDPGTGGAGGTAGAMASSAASNSVSVSSGSTGGQGGQAASPIGLTGTNADCSCRFGVKQRRPLAPWIWLLGVLTLARRRRPNGSNGEIS